MAKQSRKELLKTEDAFLHAAHSGAEWMQGHHREVTMGAAALLLVIAAVVGTTEYLSHRDKGTSATFATAMDVAGAEIVAPGADKAADPNATPPTFASEKDRDTAARAAFQKVVDAGGARGTLTLARFMVADLDQKLGNKEAAEKGFAELAGDLKPDDTMFFLAIERAAYAKEDRGDYAGAVALLSRLGTDSFYGDQATFHQGRIALAQGDKQKAKQLFETLKEKFPSSPLQDDVRRYLGQLGGAPSGDAGAPSLAGDDQKAQAGKAQ